MTASSAPAVRALTSARFLPFFVTQLLTAFNDNVFKNALVLFVVAGHHHVAGMTPAETVFFSHGVFVLPFFLFSATAGQLADRYDKSRMIVAVKAAECLIMLVAAYGFVAGSVPVLLVALGAMGLHSAFLGPVKYGILPELLPAESIVVGNAWVEMGTFLAILFGILGGGLLIGQAGSVATAVAVVSLSVLGFASSLRVPRLPPASPSLKVGWDLVRPTIEVMRIALRTRSIFHAVLAISWFWFVGSCFLAMFPAYTTETLGAREEVINLLLATFCVGIALGSMLTERISSPNLELGLVPFGALGMSVAMLDLYFVGAHPRPADALLTLAEFVREPWARRVLADLALVAVFGGFFTVPLYSFLAKRSDPKERARVIAANNVLNALLMVASSAFLIALEKLGVARPTTVLVIAGLNLLVSLYVVSVVPEFFLRFLAFLLGKVLYRLRVVGLENVPDEGPAVLVANHVSFVDWLVIGGVVRRPVRFVMDHRIAKTPIAGLLFRMAKTIPIAPAKEDEATMRRAFERVASELRDGELVCIFPEGKLTADGRLDRFRPGIERIVGETPVPVIPMALDGLWGSMFSRKDGAALSRPPRRFRARLRLQIGEAVSADDVRAADLERRVASLLDAEPRLDTPT